MKKYYAIGKKLHSQVTTVYNGACYSACAYAFLGGVGRRVTESGTFGVHQFSGAQKDIEASAQVTMTLLAEYLNAMGVGRELLTVASLTPSKNIQVLTVKQAQELNIDNSNPPLSEWKIDAASSGKVYAYTIQKQPFRNATTTFILMKENDVYRGRISYNIKQMFRSPEELVGVFSSNGMLSLKIDGQEFPLKTMDAWKAGKDGAFVIDFLLDKSVINAMTKSREMYFESWFANAYRDVNPSVEFSIEGLQRAIAALARQAQ
jgi:hypothetical protein